MECHPICQVSTPPPRSPLAGGPGRISNFLFQIIPFSWGKWAFISFALKARHVCIAVDLIFTTIKWKIRKAPLKQPWEPDETCSIILLMKSGEPIDSSKYPCYLPIMVSKTSKRWLGMGFLKHQQGLGVLKF